MTPSSTPSLVNSVAPVANRLHAYFAPINRSTSTPTFFDAAQFGGFALSAPPSPWLDLGWVSNFARKAETKVGALRTGAPAIAQTQVRSEVAATVSLDFESWGKLQLAVAAGSEQMNLLVTVAGTNANGSGGTAAAAVPLAAGSTSTVLNIGSATAGFNVGDIVAVDLDYIGQIGYVGSGVSGACVTSSGAVGGDLNYIRRVTLNVGRVVAIGSGTLTLGAALLAGAPAAGMQLCLVTGFCDREGGRFFQEWSALFVFDGVQGDRVIYHYPRLQALQGSSEMVGPLSGTASSLERVRLTAAFRALPVIDSNDSATVLCFRSYLPGPMRAI